MEKKEFCESDQLEKNHYPQKNKCLVCLRNIKCKSIQSLTIDNQLYDICYSCIDFLLKDKYDYEISIILEKAINILNENDINISYAINSAMGRYTIQEAKRRTKLRRREISGKSNDIFDNGRRLPGNFRSRK